MKKTVAVTGASGHIGNVICRMLLEKGYHVKALYHTDDRALKNLAIESARGNILDKNFLNEFIDNCDIVIHCAAIITIHGDPTGIIFKTNTEGAANVLEISKKKGVKKLIHFSSVHAVMEAPSSEPLDEKRPYKTSGSEVYDYSKATGEQLMLNGAKDSEMEVVVVRPSSVIGRFDFKPSEMGKALLDFYNEKIPALPEGGYDFVDVRDVAHSAIEAIEKGKNGEVYLLSGKYYTLKDFAAIVRNVTGKKVPSLVIPYAVLKLTLPFITLYSKIMRAAPVFTKTSIEVLKYGHTNMNHSKATQHLGHNARPLEETIRDFYEWQNSQGVIH